MELKDALAKASLILREERSSPTVDYDLDPMEVAAGHSGESALLMGMSAVLSAERSIANIRSQRPRRMQEHPRWWAFKSVNFDLLCALYARIPAKSRLGFAKAMLHTLGSAGCDYSTRAIKPPNWNRFTSELPLIAEFCLRNGATDMFLQKLHDVQLSPGKAVLLRHLEDVVALNFTIFTDAQYEQLECFADRLRTDAAFQCQQSRKVPTSQTWAGQSVEKLKLLIELAEGAAGLVEECRRARYLYVRGELLEGLNLEVNQDKIAVQNYLQQLGFPETLARSIDEAERLYHDKGNEFGLKASMGLLRSFLENLQREILPAAHVRFGGKVPQRWGEGLQYLRTNGVLSQAEEAFAASLYTLMSDEAVHPIVADREYARLFRNVVIEYALLFLSKLNNLV